MRHYRYEEDWTAVADKVPARQGFYLTRNADKVKVVAEYREYDKKVGKAWYQHVGEKPTDEKKPKLLEGVTAWAKATKEEIDAALKRELTTEELIEKAYKDEVSRFGTYPRYTVLPPENRKVEVGEAVELGNLADVRVEALKEDGRIIVYSYKNTKTRDNPNPVGRSYSATLWVNIVPLREQRTDVLTKESILTGSFHSSHLWALVSDVTRGLDSSPDYQRGYVWTEDDQQRYLDALMAGRDIGRFIIVERPYPLADQVLDGKQRLDCLIRFIQSEIAWRGIYFHQLSKPDRSMLDRRVVQIARLKEDHYTRADLLRVFLEVNSGGVPQSEEHLEMVRQKLKEAEAQAS